MERSLTSPDSYIASLDDDDRKTMTTIDDVIVREMPGRSRVLWEGIFWGGSEQRIIGYGDLVQRRAKGGPIEWFAVGLARQTSNFSVYVNAVHDGAYLGQHYADRLGSVKLGSASIGFRRLDLLDLDVFSEMIAHAHRLTPGDERL